MTMTYSKLFEYKIISPNPYKPEKMSRWAETTGFIDLLIVKKKTGSKPVYLRYLAKHRVLILNVSNRELKRTS
jgi:hypothetical protein